MRHETSKAIGPGFGRTDWLILRTLTAKREVILSSRDPSIDPNDRLTEQEYWRNSVRARSGLRRRLAIFDDIATLLPRIPGLNLLEIGCAPGTILSDFCIEFGYTAHGIEYATDGSEIRRLLEADGVNIGEIHAADFFAWQPRQRYDIVLSVGFIEHFANADEVIDRHFSLCAPGGLVVVAMPNFARGQYLMHWLFDRSNLVLHNTRIMNERFLTNAARRNSAEVIAVSFAGGHYEFWREPESEMGWLKTRLYWRLDRLIRALVKWFPGRANRYLSPYLFAVMRVRPYQ